MDGSNAVQSAVVLDDHDHLASVSILAQRAQSGSWDVPEVRVGVDCIEGFSIT